MWEAVLESRFRDTLHFPRTSCDPPPQNLQSTPRIEGHIEVTTRLSAAFPVLLSKPPARQLGVFPAIAAGFHRIIVSQKNSLICCAKGNI
jgi:hypothetical protein